jgi:hypothetical protein
MRLAPPQLPGGAAPARAGLAAACMAMLLPAASPAQAAPAPGQYDAELCVALGAAAPSCGPADLDWRRAGQARLRVSDIVYTLRLRTSQVDVALLHGAMQIDDFTAIYEWSGDTLRFVDAAKNVSYEVRFGRAR